MTGQQAAAAIEFCALAAALLLAAAWAAWAARRIRRDERRRRQAYGPRIRRYRYPLERIADPADTEMDPYWPSVRATMPGTAQQEEITSGT